MRPREYAGKHRPPVGAPHKVYVINRCAARHGAVSTVRGL